MRRRFDRFSTPLDSKELTSEASVSPSGGHSADKTANARRETASERSLLRTFTSGLRRMFDVACAAIGLVFLLPAFAVIATAIKSEDGGSVFFVQTRVGRNFGRFRLFKFRTMFVHASEEWLLTAPRDSRVTRVGRFLRRHKLDELPQLINVVKGEMQLVGVRPQTERYVGAFPSEYRLLLQDHPGIADPASLLFRNEEEFLPAGSPQRQEEYYIAKILPRKLRLSLGYRQERTFFSDVRILLQTILALILSPARRSLKNADSLRSHEADSDLE